MAKILPNSCYQMQSLFSSTTAIRQLQVPWLTMLTIIHGPVVLLPSTSSCDDWSPEDSFTFKSLTGLGTVGSTLYVYIREPINIRALEIRGIDHRLPQESGLQ